MANSKDQDYARISVYSKRDPNTGEYDIPPIERDIRNIVNNAIKSALPKDAFVQVENKKIYKSGRERVDIYVHKEDVSPALIQSLGYAEHNLSFGSDTKYKITQPIPASRSVTDELRKLEHAPELHAYVKEKEKHDKEIAREEARKQRELERQQAQQEKQLEKEEKQKLKEDEDSRKDIRGLVLKLLGVLTVVADVTRRILSSVVAFATQSFKDSIVAHNLGMSYEAVRSARITEQAHGLKEGTITGGVSDVQNKFGNITSLDEKALESLAVVMGSKVNEMVNVATSEQNPEKALAMIIDAFNERANSGYNSVGRYVGEENARRELYSYLLKLSPQWADIFATMQEEQHNINSLFRNQAETFEQWKGVVPTDRGEPTLADKGIVVTLGAEWNLFKATWETIKQSLERDIAPALLHILRFLNNSTIGMSEEQKMISNRENYNKNEEFIKATKATIKDMEAYGVENLAPEQQARYAVLKEAVKRAEKANEGGWSGKNKVNDVTFIGQEEQIYVEQELKRRANAKVVIASHSNTNNKSPNAIILGDTPYIPEARERVSDILSGYPQREKALREKYNKMASDSVIEDAEKIQAKKEAEEDAYRQAVAPYQQKIEDWKKAWNAENSDEQRLKDAQVEASKIKTNPEKYGYPAKAGQLGYMTYYKNVAVLRALYGVDFLHDENRNIDDMRNITKKMKEYYSGDLTKDIKLAKLEKPLPEITMPPVPSDIADIPEAKLREEAKAYADSLYPDVPDVINKDKAFPDFYDWAYEQDPVFFNEIAEDIIAVEQGKLAETDVFRIVQMLRGDYGARLEKINAKTGATYTSGTEATLSGRNVKSESGENRYILDMTIHTEKGDKTFTLIDTMGMKGASGSNLMNMKSEGDGWSLTCLNGQGMANSQGE